MELIMRLHKESRVNRYLENFIKKLDEAKKVILFGAGSGGLKASNYIKSNTNVEICAFCDNNPMKWGTEFNEISVYKPEECIKRFPGVMIVITCGEGKDILDQLRTLVKEINTKIDIFDTGVMDIMGNNGQFIMDNINKFSEAYELLEDEKSKEVFANLLNYRLTSDANLLLDVCSPENEQYFDNTLIKLSGREKWIDAGAYIGDTVEAYLLRTQGKMEKIYCFEADKLNYDVLSSKIVNNKWNGVTAYNYALWKEPSLLHFNSIGSGSGCVEENGSQSVRANSIDNLVKEQIDFIKMDIEGAEYNAILGAERIIKEFSPILMLSVYHKIEDFFEIPLLVHKINPKYKLYFRHYRKMSGNETVCYAMLR